VGSSPIASTPKSQVRWYLAWDFSVPDLQEAPDDARDVGDRLRSLTSQMTGWRMNGEGSVSPASGLKGKDAVSGSGPSTVFP
jgi:hypothetical protein